MIYELKKRISFAVSLLLLGLLLVTSWLVLTYFKRESRTTAADHLSAILEVTGHDIDNHLHQAAAVLNAVDRALPRALLRDPQQLQAYFTRFEAARLTFDGNLHLYAPDGRLLAFGPGAEIDPQVSAAGLEFFETVLKTGRPVVSVPFLSRLHQNHPVVTFARPLLDDTGRPAGVLSGDVDLRGDNLLAELLGRPVGKAGRLALVDRSGTVVLSPDYQLFMAPVRELVPEETLSALILDGGEMVQSIAVHGQPMLVGSRNLQGAPWAVLGLYPETELYAPMHRAYFYVLAALLVLFLASVLIVRRLSERLTLPLQALTGEVRRQLEPGVPFVSPPTGQFAELGELSEAIRQLMTDLAARRQDLNDQLFFLQNLIDTVPNPIFYKDAAFRYLGCNRAFEHYIGLSRDELLGKTVFEIAPQELAEVYQRADQELWKAGGSQVYEAVVKYADGSFHDVIFYKSVFRDLSGQPAGLLGVLLDITERKRAEEDQQKALALAHEANEQIDNILRSVAGGLVVTNRRNRVTHINQVAMEMLGVKTEEVIGKSYARLFRNPDLRQQASHFLSIRDAASRKLDFLLVRGEETDPRIVQAATSPLRNREGKLTGLVTLLHDVTRERELDRLKNEFISTAAHEMRTPMSVIIGYAELLLDQELVGNFPERQQQEFLQEICRKAEALSRLVDDLFDVSRIEAGLPLALYREPCDLNGVIGEVARRFVSRSPRHEFILDLSAPQPAHVDCNKIGQVFDNLISNAVKYSPKGGRVEIRSERAGNLMRFAVADEGIGMSPAQLARVFDKFYRADSSDTAVGGLGLGMHIVKVIIETHGGRIWVESQVGKGTTVSFELPLS